MLCVEQAVLSSAVYLKEADGCSLPYNSPLPVDGSKQKA
jgi:hypothetical protein